MIYLDTSAFLKLYVCEIGSETVQAFVTDQDDPLPVWELVRAEMINAFHLKVFWDEMEVMQARQLISLFDDRIRRGQYFTPEIDRDRLMTDFRRLSSYTPETGCRTMDVYHVACALQVSPEVFVSFDDRQRQLAERVGLTVLPKL